MTNDVFFVRFVIRALTLALIWCLCFVLNLLLIFGYHLVEIISSYTFSSESFQNGNFATFHDVSSPIAITFQYLEHPWVVKILQSMVLSGYITPPVMHQPLGKSNDTTGC